jgi:hypothetical protein
VNTVVKTLKRVEKGGGLEKSLEQINAKSVRGTNLSINGLVDVFATTSKHALISNHLLAHNLYQVSNNDLIN